MSKEISLFCLMIICFKTRFPDFLRLNLRQQALLLAINGNINESRIRNSTFHWQKNFASLNSIFKIWEALDLSFILTNILIFPLIKVRALCSITELQEYREMSILYSAGVEQCFCFTFFTVITPQTYVCPLCLRLIDMYQTNRKKPN